MTLTAINEANATLAAVQAMAPALAGRAGEIEEGRRLPADLVADLKAAGCFRALVPSGHGGAELAVSDHFAVLEELARADGSVGWTVMIGSAAPILLGKLPRATFDAVYASGPDVVVAGAFNPTGEATPVDGGFRVNGHWAFASGCDHADWFLGHCVVPDGREPPLRMMVLPRADVEIKDTWSVSGLRGTGSHDFAVTDGFVPDEFTFAIFDPPSLPEPVHRIPELTLSSLAFAAVAVGIAQGALDELAALAAGKVPMFSPGVLAANPLFQNQFGDAQATLRAARALQRADARLAWETAVEGQPFTNELRAQLRTTATWVARSAASVVDVAYTAGGGSALYSHSPLQRRLRDIHALTQHFAVKLDTFTLAGAVLVGQDVDTTFL